MKLLDLFCGAGGAAWGYHLAGFDEITGVDIKPQPRYPFEFIQADALEYLAEHGQEFDMIHASPPCQRFSNATPNSHKEGHPDLIKPVRKLLRRIGKPYVIENVTGARRHLKTPVMLCGSMFGLNVYRHRWFEIWPPVLLLSPPCRHDFTPVYITGSTGWGGCDFSRKDASIDQKREAMGILWMTTDEIDQAIPPAYTKFIGSKLLELMAGNHRKRP
jgi:DNA (cytosine-5)-methyltransferase 1